MKAIAINSAAQSVVVTSVSSDLGATTKWFGSRPRQAARFPNGDIILAISTNDAEAFTVGGSKPIAGSALVIGRRNKFGEYAAARTSLDVLQSLISWTLVQKNTDPRALLNPGWGGEGQRNPRKKAAVR